MKPHCLPVRTLLAVAVILSGCTLVPAQRPAELAPDAEYVAMGSSYAAGPGVGTPADSPDNRCRRSNDNYAHQLARLRQLRLVDVSCGGATTRHILGPWNELPAQIDAVTAGTRLVTVTIGGNDVGFVGGLMPDPCAQTSPRSAGCPPPRQVPSKQDYAALEARMAQIATEVHRRAPAATLVFVDYPKVLPDGELCPALPLTAEQARQSRDVAQRLAELTRRAAQGNGALLLAASRLTEGHDACAKDPWMNGVVDISGKPATGQFVPVHPTIEGMTAIAMALERMLRWQRAAPVTAPVAPPR